MQSIGFFTTFFVRRPLTEEVAAAKMPPPDYPPALSCPSRRTINCRSRCLWYTPTV